MVFGSERGMSTISKFEQIEHQIECQKRNLKMYSNFPKVIENKPKPHTVWSIQYRSYILPFCSDLRLVQNREFLKNR